MGGLFSYLFGKRDEPKIPVAGFGARVTNLVLIHYRGVFGTLVPLLTLPWFLKYGDHAKTVKVMWLVMLWFFIIQPVSVPVTSLIPVFTLPMGGVVSSDDTCKCYMSEGICLFILSNMALLLWNNSGLDRRIALWFLCSGDTTEFSGKKLVYKSCVAAFVLSIFSNKLIVSNIMIQYVAPILANLQSSTPKGTDANFNEIRYVVCNAIQTSCSIGGIAIIHSSYATLAFRAIFLRTCRKKGHLWYDMFNYLDYTTFALPTAILMIIVNCVYHVVLVGKKMEKPMTAASMNKVRTALWNHKKEIPNEATLHEKMSFFCSLLILIGHFTRWHKFGGWASIFGLHNGVPLIKDATVAAFFVVLLHSLPNGFRFLKLWGAQKRSQFGVAKPESAILWWRFVDKNITYSYIWLIGSGVAISYASLETKLSESISSGPLGKAFSGNNMLVYLLLVCFVAAFFANIMSSVASIVVFLPFVMHLYAITPKATTRIGDFGEGPILRDDPPPPEGGGEEGEFLLDRIYLGGLAVGISGSLGFMFPFIYTPTYFCYHTGKVPKTKSAPYGAFASLLSMLVLWVCVAFYAPILWDPKNIKQVLAPTPKPTTTAAPAL